MDAVSPDIANDVILIESAFLAVCPISRIPSGYPRVNLGSNLDLREGVNFLPKPIQPDQLAQILRD